ncbi:alpha-L-fucosidase 2 [Tanacetum coccineum]
MEDSDEEWVMVKPILDKDIWNPSLRTTAASDLKVRFNGPAKYWTDAVPIGNGRLGGMVWGGVQSETINLNDKEFGVSDFS